MDTLIHSGSRQRQYLRTEIKRVRASDVEIGDIIFDMEVTASGPDTQEYVWFIKALAPNDEAGVVIRITSDHYISVERTRQVGTNECRSCGRLNVKYSARHLCNTCYQREYRASLRTG